MDENVERWRYISPFSLLSSLPPSPRVPFRPFLSLRLARPLSRIWRDRYCFLFPRGMLGQFQITEITERVEANVRRPFSAGRIRAEGRDQLVGRSRRQRIKEGKGENSRYPNFHKVRDMKDFFGENIHRAFLLRRTVRPRDVNWISYRSLPVKFHSENKGKFIFARSSRCTLSLAIFAIYKLEKRLHVRDEES